MGRRKKTHLEHDNTEGPARREAFCGRLVHRKRLLPLASYGDFVQIFDQGYACLDCDTEALIIIGRRSPKKRGATRITETLSI